MMMLPLVTLAIMRPDSRNTLPLPGDFDHPYGNHTCCGRLTQDPVDSFPGNFFIPETTLVRPVTSPRQGCSANMPQVFDYIWTSALLFLFS